MNEVNPLVDNPQIQITPQYTSVKLPRVNVCRHKLDLRRQPRQRNCQYCWFAFFQNHGEVVQQCDEMFQADGGVLLVELQGKKFLHRFRQFMATIAQWKQENPDDV